MREENKQAICDALLPVLQMTRDLFDLESLEYQEDDNREIVVATYSNGYKKEINVHMDSGCAMIRDIIRWAV